MAVRDRAAGRPMTEGRADWLPYHLPSIGEEEIAEVVDTLRSGWTAIGLLEGRRNPLPGESG